MATPESNGASPDGSSEHMRPEVVRPTVLRRADRTSAASADAADSTTSTGGTTPVAPPPSERRRRPAAWLFAGAIAVALAAGAFVLARDDQNDQSTSGAPSASAATDGSSAAPPGTNAAAESTVAPQPSTAETLVAESTLAPQPSTTESSVADSAVAPSTTVAPGTTASVVTTPATTPVTTTAAGGTPTVIDGTPTKLLPGGQVWPNGYYDANQVMHLRGVLPSESYAKEVEDRAVSILGRENVVNELTIDPTVPLPKTMIVSLGNPPLFPSGSDVLDVSDYPGCALWAAFMSVNPDVSVTVIGYTDDRGTDQYNLDLAQRRSDAVLRQILSNPGPNPANITAIARGKADPVASNDTAEGRRLNRRTEFAVSGLFADSR